MRGNAQALLLGPDNIDSFQNVALLKRIIEGTKCAVLYVRGHHGERQFSPSKALKHELCDDIGAFCIPDSSPLAFPQVGRRCQ